MQFVGKRTAHGCIVSVRDVGETKLLDPRHDLVNHSPDGFEWGYGGSGPSQLAFAILCRYAGPWTADRHYQEFKRDFIQGIHSDEFTINVEAIDEWIVACYGNSNERLTK